MSDPAFAGGSDEAARWVQDALASAREWFPDRPEHELRVPLEQAFERASAAGRGEREFHAVFETELRRALEERAVIGSTGSVLPGESPTAPRPFQAVAAGNDEGPAADPAGEEPADDEPDHDRARAFGLAVGALRFHDGLSPKEIRHEHGIEAGYYSEIVQWLLHEADRTLDGDYPAHLDRPRMAGFAAGLRTSTPRSSSTATCASAPAARAISPICSRARCCWPSRGPWIPSSTTPRPIGVVAGARRR